MKGKAARLAARLALIALGGTFPASAQYFPPALIVVPPPAENYATPKQFPKVPPPARAKPADAPVGANPKGHYQGRTFVPD